LAQCGIAVREMTLPHVRAEFDVIPSTPYLFGWPASSARVSITVANADSAPLLKEFLPRSYWAQKNVGYWAWETEELPLSLKRSEQLFDEIWTPSAYSAKAIARTVGCPVRVVPHTLDFAALRRAAANRRRFGLPETGTLFGFMFDPESGIQRKNVEGLIRVFCSALRQSDNCYLVLKVNGRTEGLFDYEMVRARTDSDRVLFYEEPLTRSQSYDFMASLDVYASLHRSEGFGLTCAEAMAMGLPVVASGYSGNMDFMREDNSLLVRTQIIETDRPYGPYPAGTLWAEPDEDGAASALRSLLDKEKRLAVGRRGKEAVESLLSAEAVGSITSTMLSAVTGIIDIRTPLAPPDVTVRSDGSQVNATTASPPAPPRPLIPS
jgi:glycosyltransferase involved in cell wall biosynthesis